MRLLFYTRLNRFWLENIDGLRREFPAVDFLTGEDGSGHELAGVEALVAGELTEHVVERAGDLKIIFVPYAGIDALPLESLKRRGIRIANVHGNAFYVAERALAMTLAFYGRIIEYHLDLKRLQWHGHWAGGSVEDTWNSIAGRPCAVIGTGALGTAIARCLKVFDCRVIGFKKRPVTVKGPWFDEITLDLDEAVRKGELVFVTLPLTEETRGIISAETLSRMNGKFLVNVARGPVVDEEGLFHALKRGILKGAAIDAWYNYPKRGETRADPSSYPFLELPNVILSPHLAGFTPEAARINIEQTIENIRAYLRTGRARSEVDLHLMY